MHREVLTRLRPLPFQYIWCAWHTKPTTETAEPSSPTYALTLLSPEVRDIAAFYRIFNNTPWQGIKAKESVHFFRAGVNPAWEDPQNRDGGCWVLKVRKEDGRALKVWEETCVLVLGGEIQAAIADGESHVFATSCANGVERDHVLGLSYSPRLYQAHISIWTKDGANQTSVEKLQKAVIQGLSEDLRPKSSAEYYYKMHRDHEGFEEAVGKEVREDEVEAPEVASVMEVKENEAETS